MSLGLAEVRGAAAGSKRNCRKYTRHRSFPHDRCRIHESESALEARQFASLQVRIVG